MMDMQRDSQGVRELLFLPLIFIALFLAVSCQKPPMGMLGTVPSVCAEDVSVLGKYAYLADGPGGLTVVDVSNPSNPSIVRTVPTTYAFRVYVHEGLLYLCDGPDGMKVYDLKDPSNPAQTFSMDSNWASGIEFVANRLYLADYYNGMLVFDTTYPAVPNLVAGTAEYKLRDLSASGTMLAGVDPSSGLQTFSLNESGIPTGGFTVVDRPGNYEDLISYKKNAYVARNDDSSKIEIFCVTDATTVTMMKDIKPAMFIEGMTAFNNLLFVACGEAGVFAYDMSKPDDLTLQWTLPTSGYARRARIYNGLVYVAEMNGLGIYEGGPVGGGMSKWF
jgi:hypothetical protein